jgi:hypothetical protein
MFCLFVLVCCCLLRIGEELHVNLKELDFEDYEQHQLEEGTQSPLITFYACMCLNMTTLRIS